MVIFKFATSIFSGGCLLKFADHHVICRRGPLGGTQHTWQAVSEATDGSRRKRI